MVLVPSPLTATCEHVPAKRSKECHQRRQEKHDVPTKMPTSSCCCSSWPNTCPLSPLCSHIHLCRFHFFSPSLYRSLSLYAVLAPQALDRLPPPQMEASGTGIGGEETLTTKEKRHHKLVSLVIFYPLQYVRCSNGITPFKLARSLLISLVYIWLSRNEHRLPACCRKDGMDLMFGQGFRRAWKCSQT